MPPTRARQPAAPANAAASGSDPSINVQAEPAAPPSPGPANAGSAGSAPPSGPPPAAAPAAASAAAGPSSSAPAGIPPPGAFTGTPLTQGDFLQGLQVLQQLNQTNMDQMTTQQTRLIELFQTTTTQNRQESRDQNAENNRLIRELFTNAQADRTNDAQAVNTVVTAFQQHITDSSTAIQQVAQAIPPPAGAAAPGAAAAPPPPARLTNVPTRALPTAPNIESSGITIDTMEPDAKKLALTWKGVRAIACRYVTVLLPWTSATTPRTQSRTFLSVHARKVVSSILFLNVGMWPRQHTDFSLKLA